MSISISYVHYESMRFELNSFESKEEAKQWLIRECAENRLITSWCDYDAETDNYNNYYDAEEIEKCLQKISFEEIVEGINADGGFAVKFLQK